MFEIALLVLLVLLILSFIPAGRYGYGPSGVLGLVLVVLLLVWIF